MEPFRCWLPQDPCGGPRRNPNVFMSDELCRIQSFEVDTTLAEAGASAYINHIPPNDSIK